MIFVINRENKTIIMLIQVNTDNNIEGSARMSAYFTDTLEGALSRFQDQITTVQVHLSDENGGKEGTSDKRCLLEARLKGLKPVVVTNTAENLDIAVNGAIDKLIKSLESTIGKLRNH
jgi:ribosome-associated translation inhibitor RaiA